MGNFCCCFGSKPKKSTSQTKRLKELSPLKRAKLMKKTMNGKDINQEIHTKLISRAQQNLLRKTTYELDVLLSEPYNLFSKITDNLFLTGVGGINAENIKDNNIKHIINVTYELPIYNVPGVESIKIPVDDDRDEDLSAYFAEVCDKINKWAKNNENTVVHCLCGVSRSTTIVLAYLIRYHKMELRDAFKYTQQKRDCIRPNNAFFKQLVEWEKKWFKKSTTKLIETEEKIVIPDFGPQYPQIVAIEGEHSLDSAYNESQSLISLFAQSSDDSLKEN